jgi:tetratricopeptide (TPR) repeat protein
VFISYRRDDTSGYASRLDADLSSAFGRARVFRDVKSIEAGRAFVTEIEAAIGSASAVLVVIGREWVSCTDERSRRRLDDPQDLVRLEVVSALNSAARVIPVLVDGARMPNADELPEPLGPLTANHAVVLSDEHWPEDVERLVATIEAVPDGPRRSQWPRWLRPRATLRWIASSLAVVSAVLGILGVSVRSALDRPPVPASMTGDFNVGVAAFTSSEPQPAEASEQARALSDSVFRALQAELASFQAEGLHVELWGPTQMGATRGSSPAARASGAAEAAKKTGADLVLYGTLEIGSGGTTFTPEFFLNQEKLVEAEELGGQHGLGSSLQTGSDITRSGVARMELRKQLLARTRALAEFIVGISYYAEGRYGEASGHFESARRESGWPEDAGKALLYLFLGNVAGKLQNSVGAEAHYARALTLNPEYARARLGLAEVMYHRTRGSCESGQVDQAGLRATLDAYRHALEARDRPALSEIETKASFGMGRTFLCLSQARVANHWADAEREFNSVIARYEANNPGLRVLAAEAHANLGLVHLPVLGEPGAERKYGLAVQEFLRARELSPRPERRGAFSGMLGFLYERLGRVEEARAVYEEAVRLTPEGGDRSRYEEALRRLQALNQP